YKRQQVTEYRYINSLANRPYRSTVKTLPEPRAVIRGQRLAAQASWLPPNRLRTGVTWGVCWIWIELVRGLAA
ncbi:MAG: hypothetical protein VYE62_03185, partial [Pseudomonadota bacterium]|nr:hypothetical protein [Pseudomonadota bacterium]